MSRKRLLARVASARFVTVATLFRHDLRFHKQGRDGSGKCDALETGRDEHAVIGVVFEIAAAEKPALDRKEGLGCGYEEKYVRLVTHSGAVIEACTYYATAIDATLKPYHWYRQHVLTGAVENELPDAYVKRIERIESIDDPECARHESEIAIYADL